MTVPSPAMTHAVPFDDHLAAIADEPIYVILGVQGSGTNLLSRLLTRVFGFSVLHDRSMVFKQAVRLGPHPDARRVERVAATVRSRLFPTAFRRKTRHDVIRKNAPFAGIEPYLGWPTIRSGRDLARTVYAYRAYSSGTRLMAIKSDDLWEDIEAIDEVLPNRRIILLTRDFRDNLLSISGKNFGPIEPLCAARYVKERFRHYRAEYQRGGRHAYHVRFEDLLAQPVTAITELAAHFGLQPTTPPDAVVAEFPFRPNKVRKWERLLTPSDLAACEAVLHHELTACGYAPSSPSPVTPSASTLMAARLRDTVRRVPQKLWRLATRLRS